MYKTEGKRREKEREETDFPGCPVVKTPCFHCRGAGVPGWGTKILHTVWHSQKNKLKVLKKREREEKKRSRKIEGRQRNSVRGEELMPTA